MSSTTTALNPDEAPAFPCSFTLEPNSNDPLRNDKVGPSEKRFYVFMGLTARDYFAAQALPAVMAKWHGDTPDANAISAYAMADAMLRARARKAPGT